MSGVETTALVQLAVALILGAMVGLERSISHKRAGMRTYGLVALAACALTVISVIVAHSYIGLTSFDPLRVAAAIVMGIGFIGTGVVFHKDENPSGITTAAGIWIAAAIGIAVGFQMYVIAFAVAILTLVTFTVLSRVERKIERALNGSRGSHPSSVRDDYERL